MTDDTTGTVEDPGPSEKSGGFEIFLRRVTQIITFAAPFIVFSLIFWDPGERKIIQDHNAGPVLIWSIAMLVAYSVVTIAKQGEGNMEFKGFGVEFRGASGEAILWVICFIVQIGGFTLAKSAFGQ